MTKMSLNYPAFCWLDTDHTFSHLQELKELREGLQLVVCGDTNFNSGKQVMYSFRTLLELIYVTQVPQHLFPRLEPHFSLQASV